MNEKIQLNYVRLAPQQHVELEPREGATPNQAVISAYFYCKRYNMTVDLHYNGFVFGIDAGSDINQLLSDYRYWLQHSQSEPDSD